ncbi:MAG: hypothetical protein ACPGXK_02830 [Phycisphaerae bacterium]
MNAKDYAQEGLPWFDYYDDSLTTLDGSKTLNNVKSIATISGEEKDHAIQDNESFRPEPIISYRKSGKPNVVREWTP